MKKKVIICTDGIFPFSVGGMQRHSRLLIEHLAKFEELDLMVIHPHSENIFFNLPIKEFKISGIDPKKNYLLECYRYSKRVYHIISNFPDAVIYAQGLTVWYRINQIKMRLIVNPHGLEAFQSITFKEKLIGLPFRWIFSRLFKKAAFTVSLGGKLTEILKKYTKRIAVIPNGVEPSNNFLERKWDLPLKVLFVGRFAYNKGIDTFLETVNILNNNGNQNNFEYHLIGKGPLFNFYSENVKMDNVIYHGFVADEDLRGFYKNSDIFFFPTRFEGMPTVVLEAMSEGLPIVVNDVGACCELVNEKNGFLIKKNHARNYAESLQKFLHSDILDKKSMSRFSFDLATKEFNWTKISEMHKHLFKKV